MTRKILLTILLICSFCFANQGAFAPVNPEFLDYQKTDRKIDFGYIPSPVNLNRTRPLNFTKAKDLPEYFDLRETTYLSSVKNQGSSNACWSFATMATLESRWLKLGLEEYDLSENNLYYGHNYGSLHSGGNSFMATAYFVRGAGPVLESEDPFEFDNGSYHEGITPTTYIPEAYLLPGNDSDLLKQMLMEYGALNSLMYWDNEWYNSTDYTYYYSGVSTIATNHVITLVGWDDNKVLSGIDGAWIFKNSWGTNWGENGYFYISYADKKVNTNPALWPKREAFNPSIKIYQYDDLGLTTTYGWSDNEDYGLVKFNIDENQQLDRLGTYATAANSTISFEIYDDFDGKNLSGLLASINAETKEYAGYYTFPLTTPLKFTNEEDIFIKVKYSTPNNVYPIPLEYFFDGYSDPEFETDKCWLSSTGDNNSWYSIGAGETAMDKADLCLKAYASTFTIDIDENIIPKNYKLYQNYPNPFNPQTSIKFFLKNKQNISLVIYNSKGEQIKNLLDKNMTAGFHEVNFNAAKLNSGIYYYTLTVNGQSFSKKMMLIK